MNRLKWWSRRENLEIHSVPMTEREDIIEKIKNVAKILNMPDLTTSDAVSVHKLASKPDTVPGIIVRFSHQETGDLWFNRRSILRNAKWFLPFRKSDWSWAIISLVDKGMGEGEPLHVWYRNGNVLVIKVNGGRAHAVEWRWPAEFGAGDFYFDISWFIFPFNC